MPHSPGLKRMPSVHSEDGCFHREAVVLHTEAVHSSDAVPNLGHEVKRGPLHQQKLAMKSPIRMSRKWQYSLKPFTLLHICFTSQKLLILFTANFRFRFHAAGILFLGFARSTTRLSSDVVKIDSFQFDSGGAQCYRCKFITALIPALATPSSAACKFRRRRDHRNSILSCLTTAAKFLCLGPQFHQLFPIFSDRRQKSHDFEICLAKP